MLVLVLQWVGGWNVTRVKLLILEIWYLLVLVLVHH